jgi:hypothetical protein
MSTPYKHIFIYLPYSLDTVSPFKVPQLGCADCVYLCLNYTIYSYLFSPFLSFLTLSPLLPDSPTPTKTYLLFCPRLNSSHFNYLFIILYRYFLVFPFCKRSSLPQIFHQHSPLPRPLSEPEQCSSSDWVIEQCHVAVQHKVIHRLSTLVVYTVLYTYTVIHTGGSMS